MEGEGVATLTAFFVQLRTTHIQVSSGQTRDYFACSFTVASFAVLYTEKLAFQYAALLRVGMGNGSLFYMGFATAFRTISFFSA